MSTGGLHIHIIPMVVVWVLRVVGLDVWEGRRAGVHCSRAKAALMNSLDLCLCLRFLR